MSPVASLIPTSEWTFYFDKQTTYYIPKISENKDVNFLILAPLHTALTVQMYWSNERNEPDEVHELDEVDELDEVNELDEVDEVESTQTVPKWSTSFSKREVLH